jgi:flagellar secretion chaperone FliS
MQSAARTYFQTQVTTTTQGDLLIMLFDGALKFLAQAREKILERDYAKKGILISKTLDILAELQGTLNPQKGGEMADRLKRLYLYCSTRLLMANRKLDTEPLDETVRILSGLREAFAEANSRVTSKPVEVSMTQNTRLVGSGTDAARGLSSAQAGAAGYAMAGAALGGTTSPGAAKPTPPQPSDGPSLAEAFDAGQNVPFAPQSVVLQTGSAQTGDQARPVTPVRRVMAAYSNRSSG